MIISFKNEFPEIVSVKTQSVDNLKNFKSDKEYWLGHSNPSCLSRSHPLIIYGDFFWKHNMEFLRQLKLGGGRGMVTFSPQFEVRPVRLIEGDTESYDLDAEEVDEDFSESESKDSEKDFEIEGLVRHRSKSLTYVIVAIYSASNFRMRIIDNATKKILASKRLGFKDDRGVFFTYEPVNDTAWALRVPEKRLLVARYRLFSLVDLAKKGSLYTKLKYRLVFDLKKYGFNLFNWETCNFNLLGVDAKNNTHFVIKLLVSGKNHYIYFNTGYTDPTENTCLLGMLFSCGDSHWEITHFDKDELIVYFTTGDGEFGYQ